MLGSSVVHRHCPYTSPWLCTHCSLSLQSPSICYPSVSLLLLHMLTQTSPAPRGPFRPPYLKTQLPSLLCFPSLLSSPCTVNVLVCVLRHLTRIQALQGPESVSSAHSSFPALSTLPAHQALKSRGNEGGCRGCTHVWWRLRAETRTRLPGRLPAPTSEWVGTLGQVTKVFKTSNSSFVEQG